MNRLDFRLLVLQSYTLLLEAGKSHRLNVPLYPSPKQGLASIPMPKGRGVITTINYTVGVVVGVAVPTGVAVSVAVPAGVAVPVAAAVGTGVPTSPGSPARSSRNGCP
jgi:hypothetical protein